MEQITLDLIPSGMLPVIHASQYDDGRVFKVNLTENGNPYTLSNEIITLKVRKGDGCAVTTAVTVTSGNTYVNVATTEQMTAVAFENLAELHIEKDGASIGTLNFLIRIEPDNLYGDRESGTEIHDLAHQVESEVDEIMSTKGAGDLAFDNTGTDLDATNTEDAIKEVNAKANTKANASDVYDKTYMDGIFDQIDNAFTGVNSALALKADKSDTYNKQSVDAKLAEKADTSSLATVATTGSYNDLTNKPTIPAAQVNSDWNANSGVAQILNKPTIPTVNYDTEPTEGHGTGYTVTSAGIKQAIDNAGGNVIDDTTSADNKTWSSEKVSGELDKLYPIENVSGAIATFNTSLAKPLVSLKADIDYQSGGVSSIKLANVGGNNQALLTALRGLLLGTHTFDIIDGVNKTVSPWGVTNPNGFVCYSVIGGIKAKAICNNFIYSGLGYSSMPLFSFGGSSGGANTSTFILPLTITTQKQANQWFKDNPTVIISELSEPIVPTITAEQFATICTLFGENGNIESIDVSGHSLYGGLLEITPTTATLISNKNADGTDKAMPETFTLVGVTDFVTMVGLNNIFASSGDISECKYHISVEIIQEDIAKVQSIIGSDANVVEICIPDSYDLVVNDTFELFYKGIIKANNIDLFDIVITCSKGNAFTDRYIITPTTVEELPLTIDVYGINHNLLASKTITLNVVAKATSPLTQKNILCVGDSLTQGGTWVGELKRRLTESGGTPTGDNLSNIAFIGTCSGHDANFEGYGGWTFQSYNSSAITNQIKVITCTHDKTEAQDQHSIYQDSAGGQWKLETINNNNIKIILVSGNASNFPSTGTLTWVSGGENHSNIVYTDSTNASGNPFWDINQNKVDFGVYATGLGVSTIDYVVVLLGWNSAETEENAYKSSVQTFINNVKASFPNAKIVLCGLEVPARNGLANNYLPNYIYSKYYKILDYVFRLDSWYKEIASENENVSAINLSGQFDTEHNMPTSTRHVNIRNTTTETYQSNGIHPATSGYMQIADAVYRHITKLLNGGE